MFEGVGVPLMLTYVYGVVPMSLCRNGWCRPQTETPEVRNIQLEDLANCKSNFLKFPEIYEYTFTVNLIVVPLLI